MVFRVSTIVVVVLVIVAAAFCRCSCRQASGKGYFRENSRKNSVWCFHGGCGGAFNNEEGDRVSS